MSDIIMSFFLIFFPFFFFALLHWLLCFENNAFSIFSERKCNLNSLLIVLEQLLLRSPFLMNKILLVLSEAAAG